MSIDLRARAPRFAGVLWYLSLACALAALAVLALGVQRPELIGFLYLAVVSPQLCRVDFAEHRLPNALVLPGFVVAATGAIFGWLRTGTPPLTALLAGGAAFTFLLVLTIGGGMGMGDVKLGALLAANLAALGGLEAAAGIILGFVLGGIAGVVVLLTPHTGALKRIPFGPYLLLGFWIVVAAQLVSL